MDLSVLQDEKMNKMLQAFGKLVCGMLRSHKWRRSKLSPGIKTCARCKVQRSINKRAKKGGEQT